ncbi:hypothetical protein D3C86_1589160 [compost metagenome]
MVRDGREQPFGRLDDVGVQEAPEVLLEEADAREDLVLGLGPEALERDQPVLVAGVLQLADRGDAQALVDGLDLLGAEVGDGEHLDEARGRRGHQLGMDRGGAGLDHLADHLGEPRANPLDGGQLALGDQAREVQVGGLEQARPTREGADLEGVLALQLHEGGDRFEGVGDGLLVHGGSIREAEGIHPSV